MHARVDCKDSVLTESTKKIVYSDESTVKIVYSDESTIKTVSSLS